MASPITPVTLGDLSIDAMADSNARLENYLSGLNSFSYTELTLNQRLTYDILENYFKLRLDMADMYLYDELSAPIDRCSGTASNPVRRILLQQQKRCGRLLETPRFNR